MLCGRRMSPGKLIKMLRHLSVLRMMALEGPGAFKRLGNAMYSRPCTLIPCWFSQKAASSVTRQTRDLSPEA